MPELAEVETIRLNLLPVLQFHQLERFELRRNDLGIAANDLLQPSALEGCVLLDLKRKGKYLDFCFSSDYHLLVHLRMTGKLIYIPGSAVLEEEPLYLNKHTHAVLRFDDCSLLFNDVRRFGRLNLYHLAAGEEIPLLQKTGPDALDPAIDADYFFAQKKRHPKLSIKAFLLDQRIVSGLGNIYTDEILFAAKLRPDCRVSRLSRRDFAEIIRHMRSILRDSIACGGTSFRDYRNALNRRGNYQNKLAVYGKKGEACPCCGNILEGKKIAGRSSVYCKQCQIRK